MIINHNMQSMNTARQLGTVNAAQSKSMEKLSSGYRINRAGDDAAGLAISEKMRSQIRGLDQASRNSQDGISMIQTAEGALNETENILQRMRELSVQSANDTNTNEDRDAIQNEVDELSSEIDRISTSTEFNGKNLLDGSLSKATTATANVIEASDSLGSAVAGTTTLDSVTDENGNNIGFAVGDVITATWDVGGTAASATFTVGNIGTDTMASITDQIALDGTVASATTAGGAITITADAATKAGSLSGFSIEVESASGARKEAATEALSGFVDKTKGADTTTDTSVDFQIGANKSQTLNVGFQDMGATSLGVKGVSVSTKASAGTAIDRIDAAIKNVSDARSEMGAKQNRLEHTIANLDTSAENLQASESRIRDVDMADEMMEYSKNNILSQAANSMLAQANQSTQSVLQLLG